MKPRPVIPKKQKEKVIRYRITDIDALSPADRDRLIKQGYGHLLGLSYHQSVRRTQKKRGH